MSLEFNRNPSEIRTKFTMVRLDMSKLKSIFNDPDRFMEDMRCFIWTYWMPFLCLFGLITNLINIKVFSNRKHLKTSIYVCFYVHSIFEFVYLLVSFVHYGCMLIFGERFKFYLANKLFHFYANFFLNSVIGVFLLFVELIITLKRLFMIKNRSFKHTLGLKKSFLCLFIVSLLIHLPLLFYKSVKKIPVYNSKHVITINTNQTINNQSNLFYYYEIERTRFSDSFIYKLNLLSIFLLRGIFVPITFLVLNRLIVLELKNHVNKRRSINRLSSRFDQNFFDNSKHRESADRRLTQSIRKSKTSCDLEMIDLRNNSSSSRNNSSSSRNKSVASSCCSSQPFLVQNDPFNVAAHNITKMLILLNSISLIANFTIACVNITRFIFDINNAISTLLMILSNIFLILSHSTNMFLYYKYDKLYYNGLNNLFKWKI